MMMMMMMMMMMHLIIVVITITLNTIIIILLYNEIFLLKTLVLLSVILYLRTVPPFVTAHTFCASWDIQVS